MKAIKRIRYGEKEKARLINMLNSAKTAEQEGSSESQFVVVRKWIFLTFSFRDI